MIGMQRRGLLSGGTALGLGAATGFARPALGQQASVLRMVPQANLTSIDPIWTTANITRNHAFMIYDTLFGLDAQLRPQPQMAAGHTVEDGGTRVTITLRDGLLFHDGARVLARDAVASIRRWMVRNPFGQKLALVTRQLVALDDARLEFRLVQPFPLLTASLASIASCCFVMPERVAATDPFKQITDPTGSGPFRFLPGEFNSGSLMAYAKHPGYVPRDEAVSFTAGGKQAHFDRIEWRIITDAATAAAALRNREVDWFEQPPPELQELLVRDKAVVVENIDPRPNPAMLRLNHLHPPFDTAAARRALLPAISQPDFMAAIVGDVPGDWSWIGAFTPGTAMANETGMDALRSPRSTARAKALLREAGALGPLTRLIGPTDILAPSAMTQVAAALFRDVGLNADIALSDWGTVIQRRASREPTAKGGWSALVTAFGSFDWLDPSGHAVLRANGTEAWFGWPAIPRMEQLRDAWFAAPDVAAQKSVCEDMQRLVFEEVPFIPVGAYYSKTALRRELKDRVSGFALFYGLRRG